MTDIEKKLKEMEASIKAIAEFVKEQTEKIETELSRPDYSDEVEKIKETFSDEKEYSRLQSKKLDKLEGQVETLLKSPRDKAIEERFKKSLQVTRAELDKLKHELMPKVKFIEGKMDKIKEAVEEVNELRELKGHMKELEKKMELSVQNVEKQLKEVTNTNFGDNYKKELERLNEGMLARFKDNNMEYFEKLGYIEQRLNSLTGKVDKTSNEDILQKVKNLDQKLTNLKESLDGIVALNPEEIKDRVDFIDNKLNETLVNKNHLDDLEKSLRETRAVANKFKDFDAENYREELVKEINNAILNFKRTEFGEIKDIGESLSKFKNMELSDVKKINSLVEEMKGIEIDDIKAMKNIEARDIRRIGNTLEELKGVEMEDIARLSRQLKDARESIRSEMGNKQATEERLASIESKLEELRRAERKFDKHINDILDQFKDMEAHDVKDMAKHLKEAKEMLEEESVSRQSFEKRIMDLESKTEKIDSMEIHDIERLAEEMKAAKDSLEEESVTRQSLEKRLRNVETELGQVRDIETGQAGSSDVTKINNRIQDMESNMKLMTVKLLTQQLNEFAKSIDRRLPNIVSREEYLRQVADMQQRLRNIEAPDLAPLGARVERLERKIEEIAGMMRGMYNRIPIVVE